MWGSLTPTQGGFGVLWKTYLAESCRACIRGPGHKTCLMVGWALCLMPPFSYVECGRSGQVGMHNGMAEKNGISACGEAHCDDGGGARVYGYSSSKLHCEASGITMASTRGRMVEGQY